MRIVAAAVLCCCIPTAAAAQTDAIHLDYLNEPLSSVFERVSAATGVTITVDGLEKDTLVSGRIERSTLDEAVRLILKRFNSTIVWDDAHKAIYITVYQQSSSPGPDATPSDAMRIRVGAAPEAATDEAAAEEAPASPFAGAQWFRQALDHAAPSHPPDVEDVPISGGGRRFIQGTPTTP